MTVYRSDLADAYKPEAIGKLADEVLAAKSLAFKVGTNLSIDKRDIRIPVLTSDPTSGFVAEAAEIPLASPGNSELVIEPAKVSTLVKTSHEAIEDVTPEVASLIGMSVARSLAKSIDYAFFSAAAPVGEAPKGLPSLTGLSTVDTEGSWSNLDNLYNAKDVGLSHNAEIDTLVVAQDVALALSLTKQATGSNLSLISSTGLQDGVNLAGLRTFISPDLADGTALAFDSGQVFVVQRTGTTVERDASVGFTSDTVYLRARARVSWGVHNVAGVVLLSDESA